MNKLFSQKEAANYLGISSASITNWVRHGYISKIQNQFHENELDLLKRKIELGEIDRLNKRANKSKSKNQFIPDEYVSSGESIQKIQNIVTYITENSIRAEQAIFLLAINLFCRVGDITTSNVDEIFNFSKNMYKREGVFKHLSEWFNRISSGKINYNNEKVLYLLNFDLPNERDVLGIIYQSIIHEGKKSDLGSYYTPVDVAQSLIIGNLQSDSKVLDPCCGTGQFLLLFSEYIENPNNVYGFDIDNQAIDIAKTNLLLFYLNHDFSPNITNINSLLIGNSDVLFGGDSKYNQFFDFIATNPPWGAKYDKATLLKIKKHYSEIKSKESFSFFICQAYRFLKDNGIMSFILPESFTNVKVHNDIRKFIINKTTIQKINILGRKFKKVFSSVISIQIKKQISNECNIDISNNGNLYTIPQTRFASNKNFLFDIYVNEIDNTIFQKLISRDYFTLENKSDWALGIVTGDNSKFIQEKSDKSNLEPIYKGSDVKPFRLNETKNYIQFHPEYFQQTAPTEKYRAPEKLVYKFISSNLVFAYDDKQSLTLNSANILIPQIENFPIKVVLGFLNSKLFNYYYRKKFNSIKILRGDIEQLPLPHLSNNRLCEVEELVEKIINDEEKIGRLDDYIFNLYELTDSEIEYVSAFLE